MFRNLIEINFDLLSVGIAVAAIGLLGFSVYFNNKKSITNKSFLLLSIVTIFWGLSNYLEYKFTTTTATLWALRTHVFISTWHALTFFQLAYVFPSEKIIFPKWYKFLLVPLVIITAITTLTPLVFPDVKTVAPIGQVTNPERGPGIALFAGVAFGLLIFAIFVLSKKVSRSNGVQKRQTVFILMGMSLMACLILFFNVVLPVILGNLQFIPLAALFVLPFITLTSYTIYKHKLFNIRVVATAFVSFLVTVFSFINVIYSTDTAGIVINSTAFLIILIGSIQLIKAMLELEFANERLKELDQLKSEFVSLATHQLRAPLTSIKGYLSLIQEGDYGPVSPQVSEALDIIYKSTQNLVLVVGDFLDVSRIELGKMKYEFVPVDINRLLEQITMELKPMIDKTGLAFSYHADPGKNYTINGDIGKLKQIFTNLIDNSTKYTPKGSIGISLSKVGNKILFQISDTGIGMAPELIPQLFNKFSRLKDAGRANILGTGLGLYVVKQMVEAHNGRVWAESDGSGKGSRFFVELEALD